MDHADYEEASGKPEKKDGPEAEDAAIQQWEATRKAIQAAQGKSRASNPDW